MAASEPVSLPLDPSFYNLKEDEIAFFKSQTGIRDDAELRDHIFRVQAEAYAVFPYPCIRRLLFTSIRISRLPTYETILRLGKERQGAILLDLGCCVGTDARKVVADGYPPQNVVAVDLHAEFWDLGHKLYRTSQETYPVCFLAGDIFDPSFLASSSDKSAPPGPPPSLDTLRSLTPLQHHISVIHTSFFFHLFPESKQRELSHLVAILLSPLPGSIITGSHLGLPDTEENKSGGMRWSTLGGAPLFGHSAMSWKELWVGKDGVFRPEEVDLYMKTREVDRTEPGKTLEVIAYELIWSVTRV